MDAILSLCSFGLQPRSFDFHAGESLEASQRHPFSLVQCRYCGVIQLGQPVEASDMVPPFSWIRNKEPVEHAKDLAEQILAELDQSKSRVLFVSQYDNAVYELVRNVIGNRAVMLDPIRDFAFEKEIIGQVFIQQKIHSDITREIRENLGQFDVVVTCRLLEHAHDPGEFIRALGTLLRPSGKLVIEVPDSTRPLLQGDISMLWEEHTNYFTSDSLRTVGEINGYDLQKRTSYYYPQEDAMAGVFVKRDNNGSIFRGCSSGELAIGQVYKEKILDLAARGKDYLAGLKKTHGNIILFGAGHRAVVFVNLLGLSEDILFAIDDDVNKQGLCFPGTKLEIKESSILSDIEFGVCLLSISLGIERKIAGIVSGKAKKKVNIYSTSPDSEYALEIFG